VYDRIGSNTRQGPEGASSAGQGACQVEWKSNANQDYLIQSSRAEGRSRLRIRAEDIIRWLCRSQCESQCGCKWQTSARQARRAVPAVELAAQDGVAQLSG
jgi:hypothetical protein